MVDINNINKTISIFVIMSGVDLPYDMILMYDEMPLT